MFCPKWLFVVENGYVPDTPAARIKGRTKIYTRFMGVGFLASFV